MNALIEQFQQIRRHPWLGHALLGILVLILLNGLLNLGSANSQMSQLNGQLQANRERLLLITRQTQWPGRDKAVSSVLAQLQGRLWRAPTPAVAQATVQDRLNLLVRRLQLTSPVVRVGNLQAIKGLKIRWVKARLSFIFNAAKFPGLLAKLLKQNPQIVIEDLQFSNQPRARASLGLIFYFRP